MHIFLHEPVGKQNLHAVLGKQGTAQYAHRFKDFAFQLGARFVVSKNHRDGSLISFTSTTSCHYFPRVSASAEWLSG